MTVNLILETNSTFYFHFYYYKEERQYEHLKYICCLLAQLFCNIIPINWGWQAFRLFEYRVTWHTISPFS